MDRIKVLIADDHTIVLSGLTALLDSEPEIEVIGDAADGAQALNRTQKLQPDVVIMDIVMPVMDGITATKLICEQCPGTKVLILTTSTVSDELKHAIDNGATGIVIKSSPNEKLIQAIKTVAAGRRSIPAQITKLISQDPPATDLTEKQLEILHSVTRGLSNGDIAQQFSISRGMVKKHLAVIFRKLGASNRSEAIAIAQRKHLLKM